MPTSAAGTLSNASRAPGKVARGSRKLILCRQAHRAFFVYDFAKSRQSNISDEEETVFKKAAPHVLELTRVDGTSHWSHGRHKNERQQQMDMVGDQHVGVQPAKVGKPVLVVDESRRAIPKTATPSKPSIRRTNGPISLAPQVGTPNIPVFVR